MTEEQQQLVDIINECAEKWTCWDIYRMDIFSWWFAGREIVENQ